MEATNQAYSHIDSDERIKTILNSAETFEELDDIPSRTKLTFSNGFYVYCTALFIDIRGSSDLSDQHKRPVLGKIYRAYLSECVAVINSDPNCREVFINGDCVSGIFSTLNKTDIDGVFSTTAKLNALVNILNWELENKGYTPIKCGIGLAYGRALMLKAGYSGSGINDVIWMGDVVNDASNLCNQGNKPGYRPVQVSAVVYNNLNDDNKKLLYPLIVSSDYEGDVVNIEMNNWLEDQKKARANALLGLRSLFPSRAGLLIGNAQPGLGTTLLTSNSAPRANSLADILKIR